MIWLYLASEIVISSTHCARAELCRYHPQYWQTLPAPADGQYMVRENGRWRWHSAEELMDHD